MVPRTVSPTLLSDVLLSSDPAADLSSGWSEVTQRVCDVLELNEGENDWSVRVNRDRVGRGTTGWIHRWREGGRLAGLIVFTGRTEPEPEANGEIHYGPGVLRILRTPILTGRITGHPQWSNKAPYTTNRAKQFRDGVRLAGPEVAVLTGLLGSDDRAWLEQTRREVGAG